MPEKFYVTTAIPYPNGKPHLGFGLEIIQADVLARYNRSQGREVFFLTGVDEHGLKVYQNAQEEGISFQEYVDRNSAEFAGLKQVLNISCDDFIRTTDRKRHWPGAQKLWLENKDNIYLKEYSGIYCVGCEAFLTEKELVGGVCPEHKIKPEKVSEKNYFFKLSNYKKDIQQLIESDQIKILPESRKNEALNLLKDADDFSVSRPVEKISWGIPVPGDSTQVQYVWYDALANYISAIGYGRDDTNFRKWWPADTHVIGKGILRFHAIYWPAMLLAAGLKVPRSIYVHGYLTINGEKISKSSGNVIAPDEAVEKYGVDAIRYFLLREIPSADDGDFSYKKLEARYNGDLANNLGNLVSRVAKLVETKLNGELNFDENLLEKERVVKTIDDATNDYHKYIKEFKLHEALAAVWDLFEFANAYIDYEKPWAEIHGDHLIKTLTNMVAVVIEAAKLLEPFLPDATGRIFKIFNYDGKSDLNVYKFVVTKIEPLFPRI